MASLVETLLTNNTPPTEGVDIAGNLSKGVQAGIQLATAAEEVQAKKQQVEAQKLQLDQAKFTAFDNLMKTFNRSNAAVRKSIAPRIKDRFQQYGFDPAIVDIMAADPETGRVYQNISDAYMGHFLNDPQSLSSALQSFQDAGMFAEGMDAFKTAMDNDRKNKEMKQQNNQYYAGLKNQKDISAANNATQKEVAEIGIKRAEVGIDKEIAKETRKEQKQIVDDLFKVDGTIANLQKAKADLEAYSKSKVLGTGPIATGAGLKKYLDQPTEDLDTTFNTISLKALTEMFAGMSKAVDTESERRAFQTTQPSVTLDDKTNLKLINERLDAAMKMRQKYLNAQNGVKYQSPTTPALSPELEAKRQEAKAAGYTDQEINDYLQSLQK